jgi:hypothetical protein
MRYCYSSGLEKLFVMGHICPAGHKRVNLKITRGSTEKFNIWRLTGNLVLFLFYFENKEFYSATSVNCNQTLKSHPKIHPHTVLL